jgi:hypothetical protein
VGEKHGALWMTICIMLLYYGALLQKGKRIAQYESLDAMLIQAFTG